MYSQLTDTGFGYCDCQNNNTTTSCAERMNKFFSEGDGSNTRRYTEWDTTFVKSDKVKGDKVKGDKKVAPKSVEIRREEVLAIRNRFPTKIPVIVQRFFKETHLPQLDKSKFLVPQDITVSQFQTIIRNRIHLNQNQALYLLVNNKSMMSLSLTMAEVYSEQSQNDGFLYVTYASQEVFGGLYKITVSQKSDG